MLIDGYTHDCTLTSGGSVALGTQLLLVCQVVGLPYGTPLSYTWTCPNGPCEVEGYYGRKVYGEHILAVNTISTSDGGTYTCQVTATGGQEANGSITVTFKVAGMCYTTAAYRIARENIAEENFAILFKTKHFAVLISRYPTSKTTPWQANYLVEGKFRARNSEIALKWLNPLLRYAAAILL